MKDKHECNCKHGNNGFLLGVVVGAVLVFLLGTEKGRKILGELSKAGREAVEDFKELRELDELEEEQEEVSFAPEPEPMATEDIIEEPLQKEATAVSNGNGHGKVKRFFKGVKKK